MARKRNSGMWAAVGISAGAIVAVSQALRRQKIERWKRQGHPGIALVTGASSGIGEVYARRLAEKGYNLVLVARGVEKLEQVARELHRIGVQVEVLPADLADEQGVALVEARLAHGDIRFLVNNAGFGLPGSFTGLPIEKIEAMIRVHVLASVRLTKTALPAMLEHNRGAIVNVSSLAAFFALPGDAVYGPTKAYLNSFTESLALSLDSSDVRLQSLCPGFTRTGFHGTDDYSETDIRSAIPTFLWSTPQFVVDESLRCLEVGEVICIPGRINQFLGLLGKTGIAQILINFVTLLDPGIIRSLRGWKN